MLSTLRRPRPASDSPRKPRRAALRPSIEALEEKLVLATFTPVSLGAAANLNYATIDATFPKGNVNLGGVPFSIPTTGNNVVWNNTPYGPKTGTIVKDFAVNVAGATRVHTLINTAYGQAGPNSYLALEFYGSKGASYRLPLVGNVNIRDYNQLTWTNRINNTTTVNVFNNPARTHRIDKQNIALPTAFAGQTLTGIRLIDTGGYLFQRAILYGITVETTPRPDVAVNSATTTDSRTVTVDYNISTAALTQPLTFNVYRSTAANNFTQADLIAVNTINATDAANLSVGRHQVKLSVPNAANLGPNPRKTFITVVANPGQSIAESDVSNNSAYFQKFVVGAIAHGYVQPSSNPTGVTPAWATTMASTLSTANGYNRVIPFNWVKASGDPRSNQAVFAGATLANQVANVASTLKAGHTGNVVDLHFIGHNRGAVVISQAIQALMTGFSSVITGSFIRMTMLDPRPSTNTAKPYYSASPAGAAGVASLRSFQAAAADPAVFVPRAVNYSEVFFQNTPFSMFPALTPNGILNLWGLGNDGSILNQSAAPIVFRDLTSKSFAGIGMIGHAEVYGYYQRFIVNPGLALSYV